MYIAHKSYTYETEYIVGILLHVHCIIALVSLHDCVNQASYFEYLLATDKVHTMNRESSIFLPVLKVSVYMYLI